MSEFSVSEYLNSPQKRIVDLSIGTTIGAAAMVAGAVTATVIAGTNRVNPVFRQERLGKGGDLFSVTKLRTLGPDRALLRFGRQIRDTGLDETPQFMNVLLGNMSVVGYRPLLPDDLNYAAKRLKDHYLSSSPSYPDRWQELREQCRPGITGPAQTMPLRSDAGSVAHLADVVAQECAYMETATILDDLRFIATTPAAQRHGHNPTVLRAS